VTQPDPDTEKDLGEIIADEIDPEMVGPYRFPDPSRRRVAGYIYLLLTVLVAVVIEPWVALLPLGVAIWHFLAAWPLRFEQEEALPRAARAVDFAVGHASAAVAFHGLRARPQWSVILYSAVEPPDQRALVTLDAVTGEVVGEPYVEKLPATG